MLRYLSSSDENDYMEDSLSHGGREMFPCFVAPLSPKLGSVILDSLLHRNCFIPRKLCEDRRDSPDSRGSSATPSTSLVLPCTEAKTMLEVECEVADSRQ